jgi:hypothetical protein
MAPIRWTREPWHQGGCVQNFPRIKNLRRLKCSKKSSYLPNQVVVCGGGARARPEITSPRPTARVLSECTQYQIGEEQERAPDSSMSPDMPGQPETQQQHKKSRGDAPRAPQHPLTGFAYYTTVLHHGDHDEHPLQHTSHTASLERKGHKQAPPLQ